MRKKLLLASLLVSCYSIAFAQENSNDKTYEREIGFNATFLFRGVLNSDQQPFTFMYKFNSSEKKALRLGLTTLIYTSNTNDKTPNASYADESRVNFGLTIGKEFKHQINKWTWFGGGDLVPVYSSTTISSYTSGSKDSHTKNTAIGVGLRPFLGIRYNINSRIYLAAEAGINIAFAHTKYNTKPEGSNPLSRSPVDETTNSVSVSTGSATGIYLFYRF